MPYAFLILIEGVLPFSIFFYDSDDADLLSWILDVIDPECSIKEYSML